MFNSDWSLFWHLQYVRFTSYHHEAAAWLRYRPICFPHERYVGWSCVLNCFMLSSLPCFYAFCWSTIPTSCYIFNAFYSCSCHFFNSRCMLEQWSLPSITEQQVSPHRLPMLELKFAIYCRAASLPSQASYAVLAQESLTRLQTLPAHQQYF